MNNKNFESKVVSKFITILTIISALIIIYMTYLVVRREVTSIVLYCSIVFMAVLPPFSMAMFRKIFNSIVTVPVEVEKSVNNN
ncbi:hypothetical protein [Clostridium sp.]|uniref:hypothetical protein n=1 Tax=Clostridium sp. TaxID=1506 RepID=UPI003993743D